MESDYKVYNPIQSILSELVIYQKVTTADAIAGLSGFSVSAVYSYVSDARKTTPTPIVKAAWLLTRDARLKRELEPEGFKLTPELKNIQPSQNIEKEVGDVFIVLSKTLEKVREFNRDGRLSKKERYELLTVVGKVEYELAEVKKSIQCYQNEDSKVLTMEQRTQ